MTDTTTTVPAGERTGERPDAPRGPRPRRLRRLLPRPAGGSPLFRNAYALMVNTGISAVLGLGFWLAAARYYTEEAVGQGSAAIAAMKLLAGLTALTLTGAMARFIPVAGRATGRLVLRTYAASSVVVAVAAVVFLLTLDLWGPSYRFLHGPLNGLGFVAAVVLWSLLTLQDGVLTGLRSAFWVPVGNTAFSAVKLVLLVLIAASVPTAGVFVSWVAAIAVSVVPLGLLVFRRLVPRHEAAAGPETRPPGLREVGRFLAGDYTGSLFALAVVYLVPVIVAAQVGSADNAYFYIATTIGGTVNLLALNMGASLTVEGAHDPGRLAENCRAALLRMARIMLPVGVLLFAGAPLILGVFGEGYAREATPLLRLFAVGAVLRVVIEVYFAVLRAQSRTSGLAALQGTLCVLVLGLTLLLLPRMGLTGAGIAEVVSLALVASVAGWKLLRLLRTAGRAESEAGAETGKGTAEVRPAESGAAEGAGAAAGAEGAGRAPGGSRDGAGPGSGLGSGPGSGKAEPGGSGGEMLSGPVLWPKAGAAPAPSSTPAPHHAAAVPESGREHATVRADAGSGADAPGCAGRTSGRPLHTPAWARRLALDEDTLRLGLRADLDHPERHPVLDPYPPPGGPPPRTDAGPAADPAVTKAPGRALPGGARPPLTLPDGGETGARTVTVPGAGRTAGTAGGAGDPGSGSTGGPPKPSPRPDGTAAPGPDHGRPGGGPRAVSPAGTPASGSGPAAARRRGSPVLPARAGHAAGWLLLAAGLALYWLPLRGLDDAGLDRMGGLGLVSVLPAATFLGAALLVAAFAAALWPAAPRRPLLTAVLLLTVVSLHALPAVLEAEPRFATAWQHLGFIDHIDRTGTAVPDLDARWSWPGFFAAVAFAARACGVTDLTELLRWWPTVIQLLYLAPLFLLLRAVRASWRAKWTAVWLFALCGWVGQDYFSPQGFTYLLYLAFAAVLLVWFREPRVLPGKRRPGEAEPPAAGRADRAVLLLVLIGLFAATVPTHQLTPFVMLGVLTALVLVGRSWLRGLPLLFAAMVAVWVGFFAEPYWSGHFDELFGGVGGVGGNVSSSVSGRIEGGSETHKLVLYTRVALAGSVLGLACLGWWRRRRAGYGERSLLVLAFVPFLGFGMQSYGGEMALRVFLFALPGACALAALAVFPRVGSGRRAPAVLAAALAGLVFMGGFLVARWGNEPFERVRTGEVAAMEYVYAHDEPTVRVLWMSDDPVENVTPAMPWGARDMERVGYLPTLAPRDAARVGPVVEALENAGPNSYLMVGRGQSVYLHMDAGYSADWERSLLRALDGRPELRRAFSADHAVLYELREQPPGAVPEPEPGRPGPQVTWTPWSVYGAISAGVLMLLLAARELLRVTAPPGVRALAWLQGTLWFALPLMAVTLASLVHRFWTMS
ncbi:membrane protein [Streptomyces fradiae]|nr:membrane protein [Streptomyces fradiae]